MAHSDNHDVLGLFAMQGNQSVIEAYIFTIEIYSPPIFSKRSLEGLLEI